MITLHGFAYDASSSYARGAAHGPAVIRSVLSSESSSPFSLSGHNVGELIERYDFDPLEGDAAAVRAAITDRIAATLKDDRKPLSLGGDHSVTYPILCALRDHYGPVNILHIDAHTDLYDSFEGDRYSHACPFARAVEDGCSATLVQVGLRSVSPEARRFGDEHGIVMLGAGQLGEVPFARLTAPLYVSIDLDGLDPAFAPGVSHPEPGGLTTREVIGLLDNIDGPLIGADIVELNPERDVNLLTAHVAARLVKEVAPLLART